VIVVVDGLPTGMKDEVDGSEQICAPDYRAKGSLRQKAVSLDVFAERGFLRTVG